MAVIKLSTVVLLVGLSLAGPSALQKGSGATTARAVDAAKAFLATLNEAQRGRVVVPLNATTRAIWSNLPTGIAMQVGATERNGLKFGELSQAQHKAALALLGSLLSNEGLAKVLQIVTADQVLEEQSAPTRAKDARIRFGRDEYYIAMLGTPSLDSLWMIQFGGHHLAVNVTLSGRGAVLTPTHTGAQPATYTVDGKTIRPLGDENDKAFTLMNALDASQQKQAIIADKAGNLVLGPGSDGKSVPPEGISASRLNPEQQALLLDLAREWVGILSDDLAAPRMADIKAGLPQTTFAWSGPTTNGSPAYYRIQGPSVWIEYAPQGGNAKATDHIHTIYRDPTNDYGPKLAAVTGVDWLAIAALSLSVLAFARYRESA